MTDTLLFWIGIGAAGGFLLACTWELVLGVVLLVLVSLSGGGGDLSGPSFNITKEQFVRWLIRTALACLIAVIALIFLPVQAEWGRLQELSQGKLIIAAGCITALLILTLTAYLNPMDRALKLVIPDKAK